MVDSDQQGLLGGKWAAQSAACTAGSLYWVRCSVRREYYVVTRLTRPGQATACWIQNVEKQSWIEVGKSRSSRRLCLGKEIRSAEWEWKGYGGS